MGTNLYYVKRFEGFATVYGFLDIFISKIRTRVVEITAPNKNSKILDLCTGTGGQAFAFARKGFRVVGVDISREMLRVANKRNRYKNLVFKRADATELPFKDSFFDVSCVSLALHEVSPDVREKILDEASRVTKPGGVVTIVDYALPKNGVYKNLVYSFVKLYETNHYPEFVASNLRRLLKKVGIQVEVEHPMLKGTLRVVRGIVTKPMENTETG